MQRLFAGIMILATATAASQGASIPVPPGMTLVPAGEFPMGNPCSQRYSEELPVHDVDVDRFWIDVFEVTNADYVTVLNWANERYVLRDKENHVYDGGNVYFAGRLLIDVYSSDIRYDEDHRRFFVAPRDGQAMFDHPVTMVTWYGAANYCNWLSEMRGLTPCYTGVNAKHVYCNFAAGGYRLPTEAEWEKAASFDPWVVDPLSGPKQPYGMIGPLGPRRANYWNPDLGEFNNPVGLLTRPFTAPVGYYDGSRRWRIDSPSPWGCYDMSGNVYEWCWDWYDPTYYSRSPHRNPLGPWEEKERVVRSGSWLDVPETLRSTRRAGWHPEGAENFLGFRTARIPPRPTDFEVWGFDFAPREVAPDDPVRFVGRVKNTGTRATPPFWIEFHISRDANFAPPRRFLTTSIRVERGLVPGEYVDLAAIERTVFAGSPPLLPGDYTVGIIIDPLDEIDEGDESNNVVWARDRWLRVRPPALDQQGMTRSRNWTSYR